MPTYEYECKTCGKRFEAFQKMSDEPKEKCIDNKCVGKVRRIIFGGTRVIFKGPGFYVNDYAKKENKAKELEKKEQAQSED